MKLQKALFVVAGVMMAVPAQAQDIDRAIQAYNDDNHADAAFLFYDVKENSDDPDARVKAEYYLAHSLFKAGYYLPAYQFYGEVFTSGEGHPYFLKATQGLLDVSGAIGDDTLIPEIINRGYSEVFSQLDSKALDAINYMIGMISQRRGNYVEAQQFLDAVTETSPYYLKSQYLLAIMAVRTATQKGADDYGTAIQYFINIEDKLKTSKDESEKKLYRLAILGQARAYFSQGDFKKSTDYYEAVPRFSDDWYDSMFESGWAYFQNAEFGKALGMVHSTQSPYFDDRYRAESWVLKATTYFQMCHFDRVRIALETFFSIYEPMGEALKPYLEGDQTDAEMVALIVKGSPDFPTEIRGQISNNRRYQKFLAQVVEVEREIENAKANFPEGSFKAQLINLLEEQRGSRVALTGKLVRDQIRRESIFLEDFLNQARIIKFETADAERKILELGKDITKGPRAQGPRPVVPNAKYQYWAFNKEYWLDELGYYQHSIKDECLAELFQ